MGMEEKSTQPIRVTEEMMTGQANHANQLLRELETSLSPEQHTALTKFFAERAVLNAMKIRMAMDNNAGKEAGNE
jgi:hypothetical protein